MSSPANIVGLGDLRGAPTAEKSTRDWQNSLWAHWPTEAQWPTPLDLYESAAYKRVHPDTIRRLCTPDRKGQAKLRHQRIGASFRIRKADLDAIGMVAQRGPA